MDKDFVAIEDMLKTIASGSQMALVRLAKIQEEIRKKEEAEETALRT